MRILGSFILFITVLLADVKVYLQQNPIYMGEPAKLVIEATGDEIELPKLDKIGPYPVTGTTQAESVINVNGDLTIKKSATYIFYPDANLTIPPLVLTVDGKKVETKPVKLVVKKAKSDKNVLFRLKLSKNTAYVGEPVIAQLELKIRRTLHIVDYRFEMPKFENFWVKELKTTNKYLEEHGAYLIKRIKLLLIPQKAGRYVIGPAIFKYAVPTHNVDMFGFSVTAPVWKSVASNSAALVAKPLPRDVDIVGEFSIEAKVDRREVDAGKPVNLTLTIKGEGNLESFNGIELTIPKATVYADTPKRSERFENGHLISTFTQTFSIIADSDYTIPKIEIPYFNPKQKAIGTLATEPITIKVRGAKIVATTNTTATSQPIGKKACANGGAFSWRSFLFGFASAVVLFVLGWGVLRLLPMRRRVKVVWSDKRTLLNRLMPYISKDKEAASLAQALYEEIYEGKKHYIKKKDVEAIVRRNATKSDGAS